MDPLTRSYYGKEFQLAYLRKKGTEFQNWFVELMGHAFGADFEPVRTYGPKGDFKCDGRHVPLGRIHQCYAPDSMRDIETIAKIDSDFAGALKHWASFMKIWCFVHNDTRGLPPAVLQHLDTLRVQHPAIAIEIWGEAPLRDIVLAMPVEKLVHAFGHAPTTPMFDKLGFEDVRPIIDALAQSEPDALNVPLSPPSSKKLEHNRLSTDVADFLRIGRRKEPLVEDFMHKMVWPDTPEKIAEAMRNRYQYLKDLGLAPDAIYQHLEQFVDVRGEPRRKAAALAVLSYFFERCDIFEDIDDEAAS
jgi:hypothetical protein